MTFKEKCEGWICKQGDSGRLRKGNFVSKPLEYFRLKEQFSTKEARLEEMERLYEEELKNTL